MSFKQAGIAQWQSVSLPTQIEFGDTKHINYWKKFALENKINLIDLYDEFSSEMPKDFILNNFIYGDIHWNKEGTKIVFDALFKKINFYN